jgi:hypothetical protein
MGEIRNIYRIFLLNPEGQKPLRTLGMDVRIILKIYLKEILWEGVDWIRVAGTDSKVLEIGMS